MSTIALTSIHTHVMPELPRCPTALIDQTFLTLLMEWCHETQAWTYDLDAINVVEDVANYELDGDQPSYAAIDAIVTVVLDDITLEPVVDFVMASREMEIHLNATPTSDSTGGLEIQVALRPAPAATLIDRRLYRNWFRQWAKGLMGTLMVMPKKAWTDHTTGNNYLKDYRNSIAEAKIEQSRGGMNTNLQARAPSPYRWR